MPRGQPRGIRGFTMVELIVVIGIMGVMAALAMVRSPERTALQERGFRDQLVSMLRHARKVAVSQRRGVCVVFTPASTPVQVVGTYAGPGGCGAAGAGIADPGTGSAFVLDIPAGVAVAAPPSLQFNAAGQPVPNANQSINVGALAFTVSRETGTVF